MNRTKPGKFEEQRMLGERVGNICAVIAKAPIQGGRHLLVEDPASSELFKLKMWLEIGESCHKVVFSQCSLGLVDPAGYSTR